MTFAVIDTNVIVSAQITGREDSSTRRIVRAVFDGRVVPIVSDPIFAEYGEVLSRAKFQIAPEVVSAVLGFFRARGLHVSPMRYGESLPDEKDRAFVEAALAAEIDHEVHLVTGNMRHYPGMAFAVTPARFCDVAGLIPT